MGVNDSFSDTSELFLFINVFFIFFIRFVFRYDVKLEHTLKTTLISTSDNIFRNFKHLRL